MNTPYLTETPAWQQANRDYQEAHADYILAEDRLEDALARLEACREAYHRASADMQRRRTSGKGQAGEGAA